MAGKSQLISFLDSVLPDGIKTKIFNLGFNLAPGQFETFAHLYANAPNMHLGLERLKARGFAPGCIVDVGAFEGEWSRMARSLWPDATLHICEGNAEKQAALDATAREIDATVHIALMGAESGAEVTFHVMGTGSSVFEENSPLDREARTVQVNALDDLVGADKPDFIKVDVQGYELEVLAGAQACLQSAEAVLLEVSLLQINAGAPLLADVVAYMDDKGFVAADILEIHRRPLDRATNQIDLIFLRKESPLLADTRHH